MRTRTAWLVAAVLTAGPIGAQQPAPAPENGQWLIEHVEGAWEVREGTRPARAVAGKYDVITAGSQIRCTKLPCVLEYSTDAKPARPLFAKPPRLATWVTVPKPTETPVAPTASDMQLIIGRVGVRGGATKDGTVCGGDFPLQAPKCHDTIDPTSFRLVWTVRPTEAGRQLTMLISGADSSERRRWNAIPADAQELKRADVREYLESLQQTDRTTDVTIRLMRTENVDAVRLVRLLSRADQAAFRQRLLSLSHQANLPRQLGTLEEALKRGMYSLAADISLDLLRDAPESLEIRKYALVGLCGSDYAIQIAELRSQMSAAGVKGICEAEGTER